MIHHSLTVDDEGDDFMKETPFSPPAQRWPGCSTSNFKDMHRPIDGDKVDIPPTSRSLCPVDTSQSLICPSSPPAARNRSDGSKAVLPIWYVETCPSKFIKGPKLGFRKSYLDRKPLTELAITSLSDVLKA